jgi:ketosteroid isomerase-like protein
MSEENVELVRAVFEAHDRRDWDAVYSLYAPDIVWDDVDGLWGDWGVARGTEGVKAAWRRWLGVLERPTFTAEELIDAGDRVLIRLRMSGRGRGSGAPVGQVIWMVWKLRAGAVAHVAVYRERGDAAAAAGLTG